MDSDEWNEVVAVAVSVWWELNYLHVCVCTCGVVAVLFWWLSGWWSWDRCASPPLSPLSLSALLARERCLLIVTNYIYQQGVEPFSSYWFSNESLWHTNVLLLLSMHGWCWIEKLRYVESSSHMLIKHSSRGYTFYEEWYLMNGV
jgi:hypothetical protein